MTKRYRSDGEIAACIQALRTQPVITSRDETLRNRLDLLLKRSVDGKLCADPADANAVGEARGILLIDGSGGGKTILVDRVLKTHPALQAAPGETNPRFLMVPVPSPATIKSLGLTILKKTGYDIASPRRENWYIWDLVRKRLKVCGVTVLWIDEASDLFHAASRREIDDMLSTLKSLMQDDAIIVILSGVETLGHIARTEEQVHRRYLKIRFSPVTEAVNGDDLWDLVGDFCDKADLGMPADGDIVGRLIHASRHRFGLCIENLINAIENALQNGDVTLDVQHFAESWAMREGCDPSDNVFLSRNWRNIDPDMAESPEPAGKPRNKRAA